MSDGSGFSRRKKRSSRLGTARYARSFFRGFFMTLGFSFFVGIVLGIFAAVWVVRGIILEAPEVTLSQALPKGYATRIYDSQGNLTETLVMAGANREEAVYEELPEDLINAFVAMEDRRFWEHDGIDIRSITRAAAGILTGDYAGGGSTITQQLIKNNILAGGMEATWDARIRRKIQEQYLAWKLERESGLGKQETKEQILTNYLNSINLGSNTLGVKTAARRYFGKEVSELTLAECSVLAAITSNPSRYNPVSNPEANDVRRQIVLQYMQEQGYISQDEYQEAAGEAVYRLIQEVNHTAGETSPYSYFTDALIRQVTEALMERLDYTEGEALNLLYSGGLRIETTQDMGIQRIVDEEVNRVENYEAVFYSAEYRLSVQHGDGSTGQYSERDLAEYHALLGDNYDGLYPSVEEMEADVEAYKEWLLAEGDQILGERLEPVLQPQVSFVLMDQYTGEVKAINGGRGEKTASLTLNRATDTLRQPGSAFKVVTAFAPALDVGGVTLANVYYDAPYSENGHSFRNWWGSSRGYMGYSNIRDGIIYSMNIVAVKTMMETVSPRIGVEYAENMGITSLTETDWNAATALGGITNGVSNLELTGAYAAIANGGTYRKPVFFTRILDRNGDVLLEAETEDRQVLKKSTAFLLTDAMADSLKDHRLFTREGVSIRSTSTRAALERMLAAGKSGTTTNNRDVWFVGFTPYYTAGIWGGLDGGQSLRDGNINRGGTNFHKDIWKTIMDRVHEELPEREFAVPDSMTQVPVCRKSGKRAVVGVCDHDPRGNAVYTEYFAAGTEPEEACDVHVSLAVCQESGMIAGEFCENRTEGIFLAFPEGEDSVTDDSLFGIPDLCTVHGQEDGMKENETAGQEDSLRPDGSDTMVEPIPEAVSRPVGPGY